MRFTDGIWEEAKGIRQHKVHSLWEYKISDEGIEAFVPCAEIRDLNDTTYGPAMTVWFTSPRRDVIKIRVNHYDGKLEKGPEFELFKEQTDLQFEDTEETVSMTSGKTTVIIQKKGEFSFSFYYDGKKMVSSKDRSLAYVTDLDYEADQWCDFNHCLPLPHYMKETYMREQLSLGVGEYIYGLGERFTSLVKNGQTIEIWNKDGGTFGDQSYKNIPFYLSNYGYGVLVNHPEHISFEVGTENVRKVQFSVEGETLEYMVIGGGTPKQVLGNYTALTGRSPVPPAWSFGLWLSTSWTPSYAPEVVHGFVDEMKKRKIPLGVFHYDAGWMKPFELCNFKWDSRFKDVKGMLSKIKENGVKICVWINPYIGQRSELYREGKEKGYLLKRKDGGIWQSDLWMPGQTIVDFTNPDACCWYAGKLEELLDTGVDCLKTDFAERIPTDVQWYDGSDPDKMHNYYTYLYNKTVYEMLKRNKGERDACVFARSATVGTQQFPVNWGGDNLATYESMAESLRGGLSFCQSGFGFWAHDISGFDSTATPDLYKRWSAFGLLSTHSRLHGHDSYRVPWMFDEEACDVLGYFTRLKCSLMPYLFSQAVKVHEEGIPMMRAMMLEFPEDPGCAYLDRQYMLGDSLLAAPVFREDGVTNFYVPKGNWINWITKEKLAGGRWYTQKFDYFSLPLLVKPNTLLAVGDRDDCAEYDYCRNVTFHLIEPEEGERAKAAVYNKELSEKLEIASEKNGDIITVISTHDSGWRVCLPYPCSITGENGSLEESGNLVYLIPEAGCKEYRIKVI